MSEGPPDDVACAPGGPPTEGTGMSDVSPGVCLAWIDGGTVSGWFMWSAMNMLTLDGRLSQHITGEKGDQIHIQSSPRIHEARNQVVDEFARLEQQPEWLLMLDSDMTFEPDLLERMMRVADPVRVPILGGLCFGGGRVNDPFPTLYKLLEEEEGERSYYSLDKVHDYPRDALVSVGATGAACLLIHRQVFAVMKTAYGSLPDGSPNPSPWFAEGITGLKGEGWGEDTVFCLRAQSLRIPVHVHTGIKLGHVKENIIDEAYYDRHREVRRQNDLWATAVGNGSTPKLSRAERRRRAREAALR
jgi:hypothetical protein